MILLEVLVKISAVNEREVVRVENKCELLKAILTRNS